MKPVVAPVRKIREVEKIDPPTYLVCDSKIKRWAWANGYGVIVALLLGLAAWLEIVVARFV